MCVYVFIIMYSKSKWTHRERKNSNTKSAKFSNTTRYNVVMVINKSKIKE